MPRSRLTLLLAVLVSGFVLMTSGCAGDAPPPVRVVPPQVVDLAPVRCAEIDATVRAEAVRTTPVPPNDARDTDGTPALSRASVRSWISRLEVSEAMKNQALARVIDSHERCAGRATETKRATS